MNVVVCVKQIPDPAAPAALDPVTKTLVRSGKLIMDDSDNYGVEMALQLAGGEGDEVTLVSMAPGGETSGLRTGLAMGAARAILVDAAITGDGVGEGDRGAFIEGKKALGLGTVGDCNQRRVGDRAVGGAVAKLQRAAVDRGVAGVGLGIDQDDGDRIEAWGIDGERVRASQQLGRREQGVDTEVAAAAQQIAVAAGRDRAGPSGMSAGRAGRG